jgi:DNA-binding MarR family transcriptional regulator
MRIPVVPIPLDNQICFSLYATSMAITRTYKPMLDAMGITYPQYLVLNVLGEAEGGGDAETGGATVGAIAQRLALESPLVKRLEQAGLVARRRGTVDERQVQVSLTDAGRALLNQCDCLGETLLAKSAMTLDQLDALNRQVQTLRTALVEG